jgi:hypothetical protein
VGKRSEKQSENPSASSGTMKKKQSENVIEASLSIIERERE